MRGCRRRSLWRGRQVTQLALETFLGNLLDFLGVQAKRLEPARRFCVDELGAHLRPPAVDRNDEVLGAIDAIDVVLELLQGESLDVVDATARVMRQIFAALEDGGLQQEAPQVRQGLRVLGLSAITSRCGKAA